jgi:DNA repair protein RadC
MPFEDIARLKAKRGDYGPGDAEELARRRMQSKQRGDIVREERTMGNGRIYTMARDPLPGGGSVTTHTDVTELKMSEKMLRNKNRELETLYRISEITGTARSLNVALSQIVEQISLDTGFPIVTIEIYDDKRDMMILGGATGEPPLSDKTPVEAPVEEALSGLVVRTGRPVLESETSLGPLHSAKTSPRPGVRTFVGMPMMSDGQVLGALCVASTKAVEVGDGRLKWLQSLANTVASLIERKWAQEMLREPGSYREELRRRFLKDGGDSMGDRALLELVLQPIRPNVNVKALAKDLIAQFGGFAEVIAAAPKRLVKVKGIGENTVVALKSVDAAAVRLTRERALNRPLLSSWGKLLDYCRASMAHAEKEELRVLFLDRQNVLIADEVQQIGTIDHTPLYPREVIKRALDHGASAIVLAHNHPSGDPTPSQSDIEMTNEVRDAGEKLGITLHDHFIIGKRGHASLKKLGLL